MKSYFIVAIQNNKENGTSEEWYYCYNAKYGHHTSKSIHDAMKSPTIETILSFVTCSPLGYTVNEDGSLVKTTDCCLLSKGDTVSIKKVKIELEEVLLLPTS